MVCHLFGTRPFHAPVLTYTQTDSEKHFSMKIHQNIKQFYSPKCIWESHLQDYSHLVQAYWMCYTQSYLLRNWQVQGRGCLNIKIHVLFFNILGSGFSRGSLPQAHGAGALENAPCHMRALECHSEEGCAACNGHHGELQRVPVPADTWTVWLYLNKNRQLITTRSITQLTHWPLGDHVVLILNM